MDKDYLQNIAGSPYVEEGTFDRALARGTEFGQRTLAEVGIPTAQSSERIKVQDKFQRFVDELKVTLRPFVEGPDSVINKLKGLTPPMTPSEAKLANQLVILYRTLFRKGVFPSTMDPQTRRGMAKGLFDVPNSSREEPHKGLGLRELMIPEGKQENFTLAKALSTNNATQIVMAYVNAVKSIYDRFLSNIQSSIPNLKTKNDVEAVVKKHVVDPQSAAVLDGIGTVLKSIPPPVVPPTGVPPIIPPADTSPTSSAQPKTGNNQQVANDFVALVGASIQLLWQRIKSDKLSAHYYAKPLADGGYYLPKSWEEPHVTDPEWNVTGSTSGEAHYVPSGVDAHGNPTGYTYVQQTPTPLPTVSEETSQDATNTSGGSEDDAETIRRKATAQSQEDIELTGDFVYDFASLYHKYPGKYSIEVTDKPYLVTLPSGKKKVIKVYWEWNKHENTISIEVRDPEASKWEKADILRFYDDQVNPRVPGYNPDVALFMKQIDRRLESIFAKATNKDEISKHLNNLKPALYSIIRRKGPMEFVSKTKDELGLVIPPNSKGEVQITRGKERNKTLTINEIMARYHSTDEHEQLLWRNALKEIGYFDKFPSLKEKFDKTEKTIEDAVSKYRITYPTVDKEAATLIIKTASKSLGIALADMTADALFDVAVAEQAKNPEAKIAKEILIAKAKWNPKDAEYYVEQAKMQLGPSYASEDYIRKAKELKLKEPSHALTMQTVKDAIEGLVSLGYGVKDSKKAILQVLRKHGSELSTVEMIQMAIKVTPDSKIEPFPGGKVYEVPDPHDKTKSIVIWESPRKGVQYYHAEEVLKRVANPRKSPNFIAALKKYPSLYQKYGGKLNERFINPFQMTNFL